MESDTIIEMTSALVAISIPFAATAVCLGGLVGVGAVVAGYLALTVAHSVAIRRAIRREEGEESS